ncbi:23S rRNA (uracil(747)-C(5))-methyltransferase RlmC [Blastococcus sp. Marseille-P5729]|uniref:23S rRNA (uracil(747)-C(5))-methyltransferase RlmC n=1 Tax=Blastococcus sp. Marseille-P5729 TaxID=2086582 RepID=UPI000D1033E4|nr:23S rRNA (uracil(747)-C(5))-methyltransferase RlmC [Blastococcus sp. Marseille-P5729]
MQCDYFDSARCRSCTLMGVPYDEQLRRKDDAVRRALADVADHDAWSPPFASREAGFRNKAKLAVGGTISQPTLGIMDRQGTGIDLRGCGLYEAGLGAVLPRLGEFVTQAAIAPYHLGTRRGELKNLLVTHSPDGELMVRFVLRSQEAVSRIRKHLPDLRRGLPQLRVASANILPEHKAVLEGDLEIPLTDDESLPMRLDEVTLHLRPQSFFQTNTAVAEGLYAQAQQWCAEVDGTYIWDLYCGVGGFGLHLAATDRRVTGIETSPEAVASARLSAVDRPGRLEFFAQDAVAFARARKAPDLVVVNPPRRGIGDLTGWIEASSVATVLYSSCNAQSLAVDLSRMPSMRVTRARMFDMFPQTNHHEVLVLLQRR